MIYQGNNAFNTACQMDSHRSGNPSQSTYVKNLNTLNRTFVTLPFIQVLQKSQSSTKNGIEFNCTFLYEAAYSSHSSQLIETNKQPNIITPVLNLNNLFKFWHQSLYLIRTLLCIILHFRFSPELFHASVVHHFHHCTTTTVSSPHRVH